MTSKKRPARERAGNSHGRVFRLTYSNGCSEDNTDLFRGRDAIAAFELLAPLLELGYTLGTTIHFYPNDERDLTHFPAFKSRDLLVLTTRPPIQEADNEATATAAGAKPKGSESTRKRIHRTRTELEELLSREFRKYIEYCTRKQVILTPHGASHLRSENRAKWQHLELYEYRGPGRNAASEVKYHNVRHEWVPCESKRHSTIVFLMRIDNVPGIHCDCIASFGIDGYSTLIWNRLVRQHYADVLTSPCFVMAELVFKKPIPSRPPTPEFVDGGDIVEVRILTTP